ncbi:MAG: NAD(P)-dependent oxidoreductase, partial [Nitrososphaera sp.]
RSENRNLVLADASTISPSQSSQCARSLRRTGIEMLGMPVMGGPALAESGELVPMVAGNRGAYDKVRTVIEQLGKPVFYIGATDGAANAIKLALNLNIALIASAVSEGITLVRSSGIDPSLFIQVLNSTYFRTGLSEKKGPKMVSGDFQPTFHLKNMLKDLELAAGTAQELKISLPQTLLAQQIFRAANNSGFSEMDYTSICAFLAKINGMDKSS